ncbi:hypothetical protein Scep_004134 [Stephania cephalantha]|uniref:Uncharacterized protein n=1 Tax=Stephania cephalantha TaxID=152367 RepID=A0AAP0KUE6_9MAGN
MVCNSNGVSDGPRRYFWAGKLLPKPSSARPRGKSAATWSPIREPRGGIAKGTPAEKLGRHPTALELCIYFHTKDHDGITFLDSRVEKIVTAIQRRRIELTQSQLDTPIDETELYLSIIERDDKRRTYGLGWTPSGSRRRHATAGEAGGGAGGGDGARSSRPISSPNEPVKLLRRDFRTMQTHILRIMQDHTLTQYQLREVQVQLRRMEQALMDKLEISFALVPPRDVPTDDSEIDDDPDD